MNMINISKFSKILFLAIFVFSLMPNLSGVQAVSTVSNQNLTEMTEQMLQLQIEILKLQIARLTSQLQSAQTTQTTSSLQSTACAQLEISWEAVPKATSYRLYRDGAMVYEGNKKSFVDSGLILDKKYRYTVYGLYRGVQGKASEVMEVKAPNICPPSIPKLSFKADPCGGQITVSWPVNSKATTYELYRGSREIYVGSLNRYIDSGLTPNKKYEYKIRAGNRGGWSEFSVPVSFTSSSVCASTKIETSTVVETASGEGELVIETKSSPSNSTKIRAGSTNQSVAAFGVEAEDADVNILRMDLYFDCKAWLYLDKVKIKYRGKTIAEEEIDSKSFLKVGDNYRLRFENFQALVKKGKTDTLTVRVDAKEIQPGEEPNYINVFLENDSVRSVDGAGLKHYVPVSGGGLDGDFSRTFRIEQEKEE